VRSERVSRNTAPAHRAEIHARVLTE